MRDLDESNPGTVYKQFYIFVYVFPCIYIYINIYIYIYIYYIYISKSDTGKLSKKILDKINSGDFSSVRSNQSKNSQAVVEWFKKKCKKKNASFIVFDIESFYLSISPESNFQKAMNFGKTIRDIPGKDISTVMQSRGILLFNNMRTLTEKMW